MSAGSLGHLRSGLSTVTRGTLFLLVATLLFVAFNFVGRVLVVRTISPDDWSAFSFGFTVAQVLIAVGTLGLPTAVARSLPYVASDAERRAMVRATLWVGGLASVLAGALLGLLGPSIGSALGSPAIGLGLEFFAIAVTSLILANLLASIFQGFAAVGPNAVFLQIANPAVFLGLLVVAYVVLPGGVSYGVALSAFALAALAALGGLTVYTLLRLPRYLPKGPAAPEAGRTLLRFATPLFFVGAMVSVVGSGDTLVLGAFRPSEVGTYSASLTLSRLVLIGITAASYIFLPVASASLRENHRGSVSLIYATVTKWLAGFSIPLFLLFFVLPSASLGFVYGPEYASIVAPLEITVLGALAVTLLGPSPTMQVALGNTRQLLVSSAIAGGLDVGLALLLVPSEGYVGAAIAWACANVAYSGVCLVQLALAEKIVPIRRTFLLPLLATLLPVGGALFVVRSRIPGWELPVLGLAIAGAYVALILLARAFDEGDRLLLESVEEWIGRPLPLVRRLARRGGRP